MIPTHRRGRNRDIWMEGLNMEDMNSGFGKVSLVLLMLSGILLLWVNRPVKEAKLNRLAENATAAPYVSKFAGDREAIIIPINQGQTLARIQNLVLSKKEKDRLLTSIKPGASLELYAGKNEFEGGKLPPQLVVMLVKMDGEWLLGPEIVNKRTLKYRGIGWWLLAIVATMIPYFFVRQSRISPVWVFLIMFTGLILWAIFT